MPISSLINIDSSENSKSFSSRLAAIRSAGAGYTLYQAYWLTMGTWPSSEWSVLHISLVSGAICVIPVGLSFAYIMNFRTWRDFIVYVFTAEIGGLLGIGATILFGAIFIGPLIIGWMVIAWASVGLLIAGSSIPRKRLWVAACVAGFMGLIVSWLAFYQKLLPGFDYETYGLTLAFLHSVLLCAAIACYYMTNLRCHQG